MMSPVSPAIGAQSPEPLADSPKGAWHILTPLRRPPARSVRSNSRQGSLRRARTSWLHPSITSRTS